MENLLRRADRIEFMEGIDMNMMEKLNMELEEASENSQGEVDGVREYLRGIGAQKRLSEEEEKAIGYRILDGDKEAINEMVNANLRFAVHIAKKYQNRGLELMDLIGEANAGLIHAARKFDVRMGYRFSTYSGYWVNHYLQRAVEAATKTSKKLGVVSIDNFIGEDKDTSLEELLADAKAISPEEEVMRGACQEAIAMVLKEFSEREREIIKLRYGFYGKCFTLDEVGRRYGISRERARQIESNVLRKMRSFPKHRNRLEVYLDQEVA